MTSSHFARPILQTCAAAALLALSACTMQQREAPPALGFDPTELSSDIAPGADFFGYVNQSWIDNNPIPEEYTSYGVIRQVVERTEEQVRTLVETAALPDEGGEINNTIGALYASFLNTAAVDEQGLDGLQPLLADINAVDSVASLWQLFANWQRHPVNVPVAFFTETDADDPDVVRLYLWQAGLSLPDRDYYLSDKEDLVATRAEFAAHVERMFELAEWRAPKDVGETVLGIETALAEKHWTRVQNRDRQKIYRNQFDPDTAAALTPELSWPAFFEAAGVARQDTFVIAQDTYYQALPELLADFDVAAWQLYLKFHVLSAFAPYLTQPFVDENFAFMGKTLRGQEALRPRWKRAISFINGSAGELLGQQYVAKHFPESSKLRVATLVENLRSAFGTSIENLEWMSDTTKGDALRKLEAFRAKLGYPDQWRDFTKLSASPDDLLGNVLRAGEFNYAYEIAKLSRPTDRSEWGMSPQTVNAYYRPTFNEIVFPAAILQAPFFDASADDAANYGAIGAVIGHEFSHGFDDQGRKFDGAGRLRDWWTEDDAQQYEARAERLVTQYDAYQPIPDTPINGRLTLGENIADLAGVTMAYRAYRASLGGVEAPVIDGFTGDQRFFIAYAQTWRGHIRPERLREQLLSDPHSPYRYRVLGVLKNVPEFHEAFGLSDSDAMYLPPEEQVQIW